jgi:hypothetical protein
VEHHRPQTQQTETAEPLVVLLLSVLSVVLVVELRITQDQTRQSTAVILGLVCMGLRAGMLRLAHHVLSQRFWFQVVVAEQRLAQPTLLVLLRWVLLGSLLAPMWSQPKILRVVLVVRHQR